MKTVVLWVPSGNSKAPPPPGGWTNSLSSRTLRKLAFADNRWTPKDRVYPRVREHWLVDILRENQNANGGCFILRPIQRIEPADQTPLVHGMYELAIVGDAVILTPHDQTKFWVMSSAAKASILAATPNAKSLVINQGGPLWPRRAPAESLLDAEAKRLMTPEEDP